MATPMTLVNADGQEVGTATEPLVVSASGDGPGGIQQVEIIDSLGNPIAYNANGQATKALSSPVVLASDQNGFVLMAGTNRSGTITTGGVAQQLAASNTARRTLTGQNPSSGDEWLSEVTTAAINGAGSFKVSPGGSWSILTSNAVSIIGATTGQAFTATET